MLLVEVLTVTLMIFFVFRLSKMTFLGRNLKIVKHTGVRAGTTTSVASYLHTHTGNKNSTQHIMCLWSIMVCIFLSQSQTSIIKQQLIYLETHSIPWQTTIKNQRFLLNRCHWEQHHPSIFPLCMQYPITVVQFPQLP